MSRFHREHPDYEETGAVEPYSPEHADYLRDLAKYEPEYRIFRYEDDSLDGPGRRDPKTGKPKDA